MPIKALFILKLGFISGIIRGMHHWVKKSSIFIMSMSFCKKFKNFQKPVFAKLCQFDADLTFAIEKFQKFGENQISLISVENFHYTKKKLQKSQFLTFRAKFYEFECRSIWKLIRTYLCKFTIPLQIFT